MANSSPPPPAAAPPADDEGASSEAEERHRLGLLCETRCKKYACAIQLCLERHQYQERRCWKEVGNWNLCCDRVKEREAQRKLEIGAAAAEDRGE